MLNQLTLFQGAYRVGDQQDGITSRNFLCFKSAASQSPSASKKMRRVD